MVRMSDLVRGITKDSSPASPSPPAPAPSERAPERPAPPRAPAAATASRLSLAPRLSATPTPEPRPEAVPEAPAENPEPLFGELQQVLVEAHELLRSGGAFPWPRLEALVDRIVASLARSGDLFWVANNPASPPGVDYVAFHQARVAVLSLRIASGVGYDHARIVPLGLAACLFDVGLWQVPSALLQRADSLTGEELALWRSHPRLSADIVRRWAPPHERVVHTILQHHEREHGQGFPQGLQGAGIDYDAKVIGLVDTYTGLTLPPSAKPRLRPHEAVREIVKTRNDQFPSALIKALLAEISVFPPGTVVRLNTEEIGRVIAVNRNHPLRPKVEVLADGKGQRLPSTKVIDLSEAPFLYITGPVGETGR
jgi:hypothetical protein